jgi:hypothetical protein
MGLHNYNPSYSGGRGRKITNSNPGKAERRRKILFEK